MPCGLRGLLRIPACFRMWWKQLFRRSVRSNFGLRLRRDQKTIQGHGFLDFPGPLFGYVHRSPCTLSVGAVLFLFWCRAWRLLVQSASARRPSGPTRGASVPAPIVPRCLARLSFAGVESPGRGRPKTSRWVSLRPRNHTRRLYSQSLPRSHSQPHLSIEARKYRWRSAASRTPLFHRSRWPPQHHSAAPRLLAPIHQL